MTDKELLEYLKFELIKSRGSLTKRLRDGTCPELADFILRKTSFIDDQKPNNADKYPWLYRIYCVIHNLTDFPICQNPICSKKIDKPEAFLGEKRGFRQYCCLSCATHSPDVIQHRADTCLKECGVTNKSKLSETKDKIRDTRNKNGSNVIGVAKQRNTRYKKNNGKWHSIDFGDRVKSGKIKNGHLPNWNNPEKRKNTLKENYGVENLFQHPKTRKASLIAIRKKSYQENILGCEYDEPFFTEEEYLNRNDNTDFFQFKCKKCGFIFESQHHDGYHKRCPHCYPKLEGVSREEIELRNFIISCLGEEKVIISSRQIISPLELDIYIPDYNLAIEFDGLFWHCNAQSRITKSYHLNKTKLCEDKGIHLIHIFEDEWIEKRKIVESRLKNLFGFYDNVIFARKCQIQLVESDITKEFLNNNHIQGSVNSSVKLGLYYDNELVALMTFGKCRFDKKHEWEMLRFCTKLGYHIPGAAGKLLKYFERNYNPKSLVTYADRRWSQGKLYYALGFQFKKNSIPNYWYVDNMLCRYSRLEFQKHKLNKKLKIYDANKTEIENMRINGYYQIFDCGNIVFEKEY